MSRIALLFPGQGSQFVGMGADVFEARPDLVGPSADAVLGWSLQQLCSVGPEEALTETQHAQPALYALSYALWEELKSNLEAEVVCAAGHSLGEYTALAASGSLPYLDGLRLVAARGRAMAAAAALESSTMAALIGADPDRAEALCEERRSEGGRLWVANLNAPGQVVIAGGTEDIAWASEHARDHRVRRVIELKVAGAFHTPFMASAAEALRTEVDATSFGSPAFDVYANATASPHGDAVGATLVEQLTAQVRFQESVEAMADRVDAFVHVGPGDVTAGMAKRIASTTPTFVVNSIDAIPSVIESLTTLEQA